MKAEMWNVLNELDFCVETLKEIATEAEQLYDSGVIDKREYYARVRWYWYHTTARIMNDAFEKHMLMKEG